MGKLYNDLQRQLGIPEYKQDAEDCLLIYNKLKEISEGNVWQTDWEVLVKATFINSFIVIYKPTKKGRIFIKGFTKK